MNGGSCSLILESAVGRLAAQVYNLNDIMWLNHALSGQLLNPG